ncbi:MAG: biopolymer transporter ExbD [Myxococcales bacterium]|nr:biopolymer transporter ExbD [Myxococcales bacterium]
MANLTPHQRALIKKRSKHHEPSVDELDDELNIVPFLDITINLIVFLLMLLTTIGFYSQVEASLPSYSRGGVGRRAPEGESLNLNVTVTDNGIIVAGAGGKLAPGCESIGTGRVITVPKVGGNYDWRALRQCAQRIKARFEDENQVTVSADPMVQYQHLLSAMDAVRETDANEILFDKVLLSAGVR